MSVFLGIDIGTSGTKTLAIDAAGQDPGRGHGDLPLLLPQAAVERAGSRRLVAGHDQHGPRAWSRRPGSSRPTSRPSACRARCTARCFSTSTNKVIRRAILWNDQRTAAECAEIEQRAGGRANLIKLVANPAMTGFTAPKILWLRNHEPRHFEKTAQSAAAQGRDPPPADRRIRHRSQRRQRHAAVGRRPADLVEPAACRSWNWTPICWPAATNRKK